MELKKGSCFKRLALRNACQSPNLATLLITALLLLGLLRVSRAEEGDGYESQFSSCQLPLSPECTYCNTACENCSVVLNSGALSACLGTNVPCFCGDYLAECESSTDCEDAQACVRLSVPSKIGYCANCSTVFKRDPLPEFVDDDHKCTEPRPMPSPYAPPAVIDDMLDVCTEDADCRDVCQSVDEFGFLQACAGGSTTCFCMPLSPRPCIFSGECEKGTACMHVTNSSAGRHCVACDIVGRQKPPLRPVDQAHFCDGNVPGHDDPANDPLQTFATPAVCVAARHLAGMRADALVYPAHRRAPVLCDQDANCATAGHVVVYDGTRLMMKTYCNAGFRGVRCTRRVMLVNSPRMARALRLRSNSKRLLFTAMAAKYESAIEETIISLLLRAGF